MAPSTGNAFIDSLAVNQHDLQNNVGPMVESLRGLGVTVQTVSDTQKVAIQRVDNLEDGQRRLEADNAIMKYRTSNIETTITGVGGNNESYNPKTLGRTAPFADPAPGGSRFIPHDTIDQLCVVLSGKNSVSLFALPFNLSLHLINTSFSFPLLSKL